MKKTAAYYSGTEAAFRAAGITVPEQTKVAEPLMSLITRGGAKFQDFLGNMPRFAGKAQPSPQMMQAPLEARTTGLDRLRATAGRPIEPFDMRPAPTPAAAPAAPRAPTPWDMTPQGLGRLDNYNQGISNAPQMSAPLSARTTGLDRLRAVGREPMQQFDMRPRAPADPIPLPDFLP